MPIEQILNLVRRYAASAAILAGLVLLALGIVNEGLLGYTVAPGMNMTAIFVGIGLFVTGIGANLIRSYIDAKAEEARQRTSAYLKEQMGDPDVTIVGRERE